LAISFKPPVEANKVVPVAEAKKLVLAKKMTITCVKGKTTKKVSAVKPICPNGFKRKS
jgi:hypothetical protein